MISNQSFYTRLQVLVLSPAARPLRFVGTGGLAGAVQLVLLTAFTHRGWDSLPANLVAFLLAAQMNFVLSVTLTWRDRVLAGALGRRWLLFHGSIATMAIVNMLTFAIARSFLPTLVAAACGIMVGAVGNYLAGDRLVFRDWFDEPAELADGRSAA